MNLNEFGGYTWFDNGCSESKNSRRFTHYFEIQDKSVLMSDKSPLFVSASELLAHAVELYTEGNERKFKFVILHLAAVELILKDRLIDSGSIP